MTDAKPTPARGEYTLQFEQRTGYTRAHVRGERDSVEISLAYWSDIARYCHEHQVRGVLVVEEIAQRASVLDIYEVAAGLVALGFSDIRIAFVDRNADELPMMQFGETVARNRGIDGRVFASEAEAEAWLTHEWAGAPATSRQRGG
jgi:hypothetical protein